MARHLVADHSFLGLRPGVVQRQGSRTPCFLSSALRIGFFSCFSFTVCVCACVFLCFASFPFERLPLLRPHGKIGEYDLSSFTYQPDRNAIG